MTIQVEEIFEDKPIVFVLSAAFTQTAKDEPVFEIVPRNVGWRITYDIVKIDKIMSFETFQRMQSDPTFQPKISRKVVETYSDQLLALRKLLKFVSTQQRFPVHAFKWFQP